MGGGLAAGLVGKRLVEHVWSWFDEEEPPTSKHRDVTWPKLLAASALQGAIFRVTRSVVDRNTRQAFASVTGSWPGEEEPDREV